MPNATQRLNTPKQLSKEAKALFEELSKGRTICTGVLTPQSVRECQDNEFLPRSKRAVAKFGSTTQWETIAGCDCLILTPVDLKTDAIVLYFFGGGYVAGSPECDLAITASLADKTGARIIMPRYPLAPEHPFPAALDCVEKVYRALSEPAQTQIKVICGESAGGGLALALTHRLMRYSTSSMTPLPECLCLFSPWTDLSQGSPMESGDPSISVPMVDWFADLYTQDRRLRTDPEVSPLQANISAGFPPTYITTATKDVFYSSLKKLAEKLRSANCDIDLRIWPDLWHVFEIYDELPEAEQSLADAARFIRNHIS